VISLMPFILLIVTYNNPPPSHDANVIECSFLDLQRLFYVSDMCQATLGSCCVRHVPSNFWLFGVSDMYRATFGSCRVRHVSNNFWLLLCQT
jgi:hypothetical protein